MATLADLDAALEDFRKTDFDLRVVIDEIENLGRQLAHLSRRRQDGGMEASLRQINEELHTEMDQIGAVVGAIFEDERTARSDPRELLIQQALDSARLAKMQLIASRATLEGLREQLKELRVASIPHA